MIGNLRKILRTSFGEVFSQNEEALPIFETAYSNLFNLLKNDGLGRKFPFSLESSFFTKKIFNGWLKSYFSVLQRGIVSDIDKITFVDFVSLFHPQRSMRLLFDKLRRKLDLNITAICNYNCPYCYQRSRDMSWRRLAKKAAQGEIPIEEFKRLVKEGGVLGARYLKLTGGEPLTKKGIMELLSFALDLPFYEEVELLSNCSLMPEYLDELKRTIRGKEKRFHLHTSIDGLSNKSSKNTKFSLEHFKNLEKMFVSLSGIKISVNSMWTKSLSDEDVLMKLYKLMLKGNITRWTISFPYLVSDLKKMVRDQPDYIPDYKTVINLSKKLITLHQELNFPFQLSIPLIFKHEMFDEGYSVSCECFENHPCFPCHGSYLIVGPKGEIMECLLAPPTTNANILNKSLLGAMLDSLRRNRFYSITYKEVSKKCFECRYESLCQGQCLNDKSLSNLSFQGDNTYGQDLRACSLLSLAEKEVWPLIKGDYQKKMRSYLNQSGFYPKIYKNICESIK